MTPAAPAYPPLPSRDDLLALMQAALANAKDLLNDAQLLIDAGSFPRALALATLSWEELSKADLCAVTIVLPEITSDYFWKHFRDHEGKLTRVHAFAAFMRPEPIGPAVEYAMKVKGQAKSTQVLRERGLYIDYRRGKILVPSQVGEKAARKQIRIVREALAFAETAFSGESVRMIFAQLNTLAGPVLSAIAAHPEAMAEALQEAILGGSQGKLHTLIQGRATTTGDAGE